jgi:hypothetical protein
MVVEDVRQDDRLNENPLVGSGCEPCIGLYAGAPLVTPEAKGEDIVGTVPFVFVPLRLGKGLWRRFIRQFEFFAQDAFLYMITVPGFHPRGKRFHPNE